jgi:hypothetical protein
MRAVSLSPRSCLPHDDMMQRNASAFLRVCSHPGEFGNGDGSSWPGSPPLIYAHGLPAESAQPFGPYHERSGHACGLDR